MRDETKHNLCCDENVMCEHSIIIVIVFHEEEIDDAC